MEKKNIGIKDLVNLGLFTAIYFVLFFISDSRALRGHGRVSIRYYWRCSAEFRAFSFSRRRRNSV